MDKMRNAKYCSEELGKFTVGDVCLMGWSDGGHRFPGKSGGGWVIKAWYLGNLQPIIIAAGACYYPDRREDSFTAESKAFRELVSNMEIIIRGQIPNYQIETCLCSLGLVHACSSPAEVHLPGS